MKNIAIAVVFVLFAVGCSRAESQQTSALPTKEAGPFFVGVDVSKLPEPTRTAFASAEKDIELVLRGHTPACKDSPDSGESDGGTLHYKCKHYDLTVMQSIYSDDGGLSGTFYGPIIKFPYGYTVSYVRFFSDDELSALLKQQDGR